MFRNFIRDEIKKIVGGDAVFSVERPENPEHGDYSSNVALVMAKKEGKNPREVAEEFKQKIEKENEKKEFARIEIAGPGFINFFISKNNLYARLREYLMQDYLPHHVHPIKEINIEFISANPTGLLHIGHGRGAFYGDALANILGEFGHKITREYYINDSSNSVQIKELGKTALDSGEQYKTSELDDLISKLKSTIGRAKKNYKTNLEGEVGHIVAQKIQEENTKFIKKLKIKFDKWFSEELELNRTKAIDNILKRLYKKHISYEKDGAIWAKTKEYGDEEDRVIVRSVGGEPTYFLADIAYHDKKFKKYDLVLNIWGADHQGHVKRLEAIKKALKWRGEMKIFIAQLVTLKGGKLSKRAGNIIYLEDLYDAVGLDALRWFFLERSLNTHMDFDSDLAKKRSKKNPVYYVQYAHARASSILRKVKRDRYAAEDSSYYSHLSAPEELALIKKILQLPEVVEDIANDYQVHRLARYAYELAQTFTDFYEKHLVIDEKNKELTQARLALVFATQKTLEKVLKLMGIAAPEKM